MTKPLAQIAFEAANPEIGILWEKLDARNRRDWERAAKAVADAILQADEPGRKALLCVRAEREAA